MGKHSRSGIASVPWYSKERQSSDDDIVHLIKVSTAALDQLQIHTYNDLKKHVILFLIQRGCICLLLPLVPWLFKCKTTYLPSVFNNVCWHQGLSHSLPPRWVGLTCSCSLQWCTLCINHDRLYELAYPLMLQGHTEDMSFLSLKIKQMGVESSC